MDLRRRAGLSRTGPRSRLAPAALIESGRGRSGGARPIRRRFVGRVWSLCDASCGPTTTAVGCAVADQQVPNGYYHLDHMITSAAHRGTEIGLCGTCLDARGITDALNVPDAHRSSLEVTDWTLWADKTITFDPLIRLLARRGLRFELEEAEGGGVDETFPIVQTHLVREAVASTRIEGTLASIVEVFDTDGSDAGLTGHMEVDFAFGRSCERPSSRPSGDSASPSSVAVSALNTKGRGRRPGWKAQCSRRPGVGAPPPTGGVHTGLDPPVLPSVSNEIGRPRQIRDERRPRAVDPTLSGRR
ncbi:MAG: DsrE family protein [Acidimicrobiales bacterium]